MSETALYLFAGLMLGCLVTLIATLMLSGSKRKKEKQSIGKRNQIMSEIGGLFADIDSLIAQNRASALKDSSFHQALSAKLDAANRILKTNLHSLDLFFVKYAEHQYAQYTELLQSPVGPMRESIITEIDEAGESVRSAPIIPPAAFIPKKIIAEKESPAEIALEEFSIEIAPEESSVVPEPEIETVAQEARAEIADIGFVADEISSEADEDVEALVSVEQPVAAEERVELDQIEPISDKDALPAFSVPESLVTLGNSVPETGSELAESVQPELAKPQEAAEAEVEELGEGAEIAESEDVKMAEPQSIQDETMEPAQWADEEFSMETIMDLDVNRLPLGARPSIPVSKPKSDEPAKEIADAKEIEKLADSGSDDEEDFSPKQESVRTPAPEIIRDKHAASDFGGALLETSFIKFEKRKAEPPKPAEMPEVAQPEPHHEQISSEEDSDEFAAPPTIFEIEKEAPLTSAKQPSPGADESHKDMSITGDDVIDKIDAFFGFNS